MLRVLVQVARKNARALHYDFGLALGDTLGHLVFSLHNQIMCSFNISDAHKATFEDRFRDQLKTLVDQLP